MGLTQYFLKNRSVTWLFILLLILGGSAAYDRLGRFEDPEFTIKEAMVYTTYPGASAQEVEEEVSDKLETAIQQLSQLKRVESTSKPGVSEIKVIIQDKYNTQTLPQVWDELRRKVGDAYPELPPGVNPSIVNDDYSDVFGILFAVSGEEFSYREIKEFVDDVLRREILLIPGVAKVTIMGVQQEQIFVEISQTRLAQLGISPETIYKTLKSQNLVVPSGAVQVGDEYIRITPTGDFTSVEEIGNLLISSPKSKKIIYLRDIAKIERGYQEVPTNIVRHNGKFALVFGISLVAGGNVVAMGKKIEDKIDDLKSLIPTGMVMSSIYDQPEVVEASVNGFVISLLEAVVIVIVILLIFMGLRSALLIGGILFLTVMGTLIFMSAWQIDLQRISLGALIIALGMLVDNAIVVTEGILIRIQKGQGRIEAALAVVKQTIWPLFGATIVAVLAFAGIGLSEDSTGEYVRSLFQVIMISLTLSWVLAITVTPMLCVVLLKAGKPQSDEELYGGFVFRIYKRGLLFFMQARLLTLGILIVCLGFSVVGFNYLREGFFPDSTTPIFLVDYWRAQGTDIRETDKDLRELEKHVKTMEHVTDVTTFVGQGAPRFMLTYTPEEKNTSYGQLVIRVDDPHNIDKVSPKVDAYLKKNYPNSEPRIKKIRLGPGRDAKIEARFSGPDPETLRILSGKAQDIMHELGLINIRDDWRQRVKMFQPEFSEVLARATGIQRSQLKSTLEMAFSGYQAGLYREADELIPIISRLPAKERLNISSINDLFIWSPILQANIPIRQVVSGYNTDWEDTRIKRRNRIRTIIASADPELGESASAGFNELRPRIESMELPAGYFLEWGGEYEDARDAQGALAAQLPMSVLAMILMVVLLFGALRQPLIIWLTVPLSVIGVYVGLFVADKPFDFMALLGFLSLSGMLIKNAIVLIDQIDLEIAEGKDRLQAVIDSSVGRVRPVSMAAVTTVLGMTPLLFDAFFSSMAVLIMFGLSFATLLTLYVVPILYTLLFKIPIKGVR